MVIHLDIENRMSNFHIELKGCCDIQNVDSVLLWFIPSMITGYTRTCMGLILPLPSVYNIRI